MISREDFIFTIGYDGSAAVVDGQAKRAYGRLDTRRLAEKGLFRAAYCSALRAGTPEDLDILVGAWNKTAGTDYSRDYPWGRLFGVFPVDAKRAIVL